MSVYADPTAEIERLNKEIRTLTKKSFDIGKKSISLERDLQKLKKAENKTRDKMMEEVDDFNDSLTTFTRVQRMPKEALLTSDSIRMNYQRQGIIRKVQNDLGKNIVNNQASVAAMMGDFADKERDLVTLKKTTRQLETQRKKLERERAQLLKSSALPQSEKIRLQKEAERIAQMESLDDIFAKAAKSFASANTYRFPKVKQKYDRLPVAGRIVKEFQQTDEHGLHNQGVTILASPAAHVTSLDDGKIIFAGPFRKYGNLVIVEHPNHVHTVYGNLAQTPYKVGDTVQKGTTLGTLPVQKHPQLYFEVRQDGTPVNPANWLKVEKL